MAITPLTEEGEKAYNDGLAAELERLKIKNEKKQISKEKKTLTEVNLVFDTNFFASNAALAL